LPAGAFGPVGRLAIVLTPSHEIRGPHRLSA
jgi:hypothetical protein